MVTIVHLYPKFELIRASAEPVLPEEASIICIPGLSEPSFIALSSMYLTILSFMLPLGLYYSNLTYILTKGFGQIF